MSEAQIQHQQHETQNTAAGKKTEVKANPLFNPLQMLAASETLRPEDMLNAQHQIGNQLVQRALDKKSLQERATNANGALLPELDDAIQKKRGGGVPLPDSVRKEAKQALGRDFKDVKIHTDDESHRLSRAIHARAFTIGKDIFFKRGVFAPGTSAGRETIIHELTHVIQQSESKSSGPLKLGAPDTAHEDEANRLGKKYSSVPGLAATRNSSVQRQGEKEEVQSQAEEEIQAQEEDEVQTQVDPDGEAQTQEEEG